MSTTRRNPNVSVVEREYQAQVNAMTVAEKMERSAAMFKWAREIIARQIKTENPTISDERLRWEVAYRNYAAEPQARALIERMLARVSA
jgi:hypothetical protein